ESSIIRRSNTNHFNRTSHLRRNAHTWQYPQYYCCKTIKHYERTMGEIWDTDWPTFYAHILFIRTSLQLNRITFYNYYLAWYTHFYSCIYERLEESVTKG